MSRYLAGLPDAEVARLAIEGYPDAEAEICRRDPYLGGLHTALQGSMGATYQADQDQHGFRVGDLGPELTVGERVISGAYQGRLVAIRDGGILLWDGTTSPRELRLLREQAHLSIRDAARALGKSPSVLARWERLDPEVHTDPPAWAVVRLVRLAGASIETRVTSPRLLELRDPGGLADLDDDPGLPGPDE